MWCILLSFLLTLVSIKIIRISFFWKSRGISYEPYWRYLYRMLWQIHRQPVGEVWYQTCQTYGPKYGSYRGLRPVLVLTDVESVKEVLIKHFDSFFNRSFEGTTGDPLWDNTIIQLPYEKWKPLRTIMGSAFTATKMRGIMMKLDMISKRLTAKLGERENEELVLNKYLKAYALDSVTAIALGLDINSLDNENNDFIKYTSNTFKPGLATFLFMVAPSLIKYIPFVNLPPKAASNFIKSVTKQVLEKKRKQLDDVIASGTPDILDLHMMSQKDDTSGVLTDDVLSSQVFLFLISTDNTLLSLDFTLFFLTVHPEVQQKAFEEVDAVMNGKTEVGYEEVQKMKFLEACVFESLRIVPLGGFLDRVCSSELEVAGQRIEKGMIIEFNTVSMHRNPEYFPEPEKFRPERFLRADDGSQSDASLAFMFFGHGPKNCVGKRLALMSVLVLLANVLMKFRLEKTDKTPSVPLVFKPGLRISDVTRDPLCIKLVPRLQNASE